MELTNGVPFHHHADIDLLPERLSYFGDNFGTTQRFNKYIEGYHTALDDLIGQMRYPIKKDLSSVHDEIMRLDVYALHE